MDIESIKEMDPHMLASIVNMKLRDFYSSLTLFCYDLELERGIIEEKLERAGYSYIEEINQFK